MDNIKGIPKKQYFRNYYEKRKTQVYCVHCKVYYGLKYKHLKTMEHKLNLCNDFKININLI